MRSYKYRVYRQYPQLGIFSAAAGVLSLVLWLVPLAGVVSAYIALLSGRRSLDSDMGMVAATGLVSGWIGLILSVLRSGLGYLAG